MEGRAGPAPWGCGWPVQPLPGILQAGGPCSVALLRFASHQSGCPEFSALPAKAPGREASLCGRSRLAPRRSWGGVFPWLKSSPCHPEAKPQLCCWAGTGTCPEPAWGGRWARGHTARWGPHFLVPVLSRFTDETTEAPKSRPCPGPASTSWGPQSRPPGQAGAKEPRRLETGEARQLVRSLPWRCAGACLLVSVPAPQRPLGPAPGQTRLRASGRGTVGPAPGLHPGPGW